MLIEKNNEIKQFNPKIMNNDNTNNIIDNNNNNIDNISQVTREIYYFKNEILKEFNQIEERINSKISLNTIDLAKHQNEYDNQFKLISEKTQTILEKIAKYDSFKEKIDNLIDYKIKNEESLLINKINLDDIKQEIKNNFNKYDNIFKKHVIGEGLIGDNCQFKTYTQMMRYVLDNIIQLNNFKEKNNIDLKSYKNKLETLILSFKTQIDNIMNTMTQFTTKNINDCEHRMKGLIGIYDERLVDLRVNNNNYIRDLNDKYDKLSLEWNEIIDVKNDIYKKIDDIIDIKNLFENNINEIKNEFNKYDTEYSKLKEDVEILKNSILSAREKQLIYSKKIKYNKRALDEDDLYIDTKSKKKKSNYNFKNEGKWKEFIEKSFNKVIQNNNPSLSDESNIYNIDKNKRQLRKTLTNFGLKYNRKRINDEENKILNIKECFESFNEEDDEKNKTNINIEKKYQEENNKNVNKNIEDNMELLSNKTLSEENESDKHIKDIKNEQISTIDNYMNKINKEKDKTNINKKININYKNKNIFNNKDNKVLNIKKIKFFNNIIDDSLAIKDTKLIDQINYKITNTNSNKLNNSNNTEEKEVEKNKIKNIIFPKEIENTEVELPKIDDVKRYFSTDQDVNKDNIKFQKIKKNIEHSSNTYLQGVVKNLKKFENSSTNTYIMNEKNNLFSFKQKFNKTNNNKYYSIISEKEKEKKHSNIKKLKDSVSMQEIVFNPFKNFKNKLYKGKKSKDKIMVDYSFNNLKNITNLNNTNNLNNNNDKNNNINNNSNYKISSAHSQKKKEENDYINSKGEYSNIITIPPPYDSIHKSIFGGY